MAITTLRRNDAVADAASPKSSGGASCTVASSVDEAERWVTDWQALADRAADPNPFYEPWCLLPALQTFNTDPAMQLVFVSEGQQLIGVFPLEIRPPHWRRPIRHLASWRHPHLYLASPLVAAGRAELAWQSLTTWAGDQGAALIHLTDQLAEGPTAEALRRAVGRRAWLSLGRFDRAFLVRGGGDAEGYLARSTSSGSRKNWRRLTRRLSELGQLEIRALVPGDAVAPWIAAFLALESAGWKGQAGTALASRAADESYFRTMAAAAHDRRALHFLGLFLDGVPIAMQVNLLSGGRGFALKVAFDEALARYSPGVLLEVAAIRDCWQREDFVWMDSCASASNPLIGRLWDGTRAIENRLVATGTMGRLALAAVKLARRRQRDAAPRPEAPG
jgi:CelD/BcsL family acetyltransferase involved in cellulose biosynthesis